jgi:arylsulfatase A-like enzyme
MIGMRARTASAIRAAFFLCLLAACGEQTVPPRNVVIVTVDTLAAGHVGCYGYERNTSPLIDIFAERATRYSRAYASSPWTLPTHASLFTGKYSFEHGARTYRKPPTRSPLDPGNFTLAEALHRLGFQTAGFTANNSYLTTKYQLDQGFTEWVNERSYGIQLNEKVFKWLDEHGEQPFFLFLNYMDVHTPYNTKAQALRPDFLPHAVGRNSSDLLDEFQNAVLDREHSYPSARLDLLVDLYDLSIANVDEAFGNLLYKLQSLDLYDETLIIFTSDHGEVFGQHDLIVHGREVYEELIRVPLIVKHAGQRAGRVVDGVVTSTDMPHMILSQLSPEQAKPYLLLFPDAPGNHLVISENYYDHPSIWGKKSWAHRFDRERTAVIDWPYKYIHSSDGQNELYQLEEDPGEIDNRLAREPQVAQGMARQLEQLYGSREHIDEARGKPVPPTKEELETLRALGYIVE